MSLGGEKHLNVRRRGVESRGEVARGHLEGLASQDGFERCCWWWIDEKFAMLKVFEASVGGGYSVWELLAR
jgi:hypothetical protein